jgi:cytochrome oxidase Cu insertion factor (SCO1/SenC/PrrC family)
MNAPAESGPSNGSKRNLWPLWAMIAVFAAPVMATWFYFFYPQYLPNTRSNRGALLDPVIPLPAALRLTTPIGEPFNISALSGAWTLVYLTSGGCDEPCVNRLIHLRQIRLGLGESRKLVERMLLIGAPSAPVNQELMGRAFEGMHVAQTDADGLARLTAAIGDGNHGLGRVYLLDPVGRLMMRYAADAPPDDILNDTERLLKGSKNWIKGANYGHN